jgi:hypothetical protein
MPNGPEKIILIRAGRYDYADVELSGSIQIVGPNNTGKTTLINTLQFLYVDDLRTMSFGSYTLEQTLTYYFPSQYSYVLFQCLGTTGRCVIGWRGQSKTSGADPERFCYLGEYDAQDYFDEKRQVREPREIAARLALKEFRLIKSAQEHRELLLPPAGADGQGLGIVALRDPDRFRRFRESLKDLLSLSTISQEQMRERLLTLADVRVDLPAFDARKLFGDDYDQIRRRRDGLARFKKHEEQVRLLVQHFEDLTQVRGELIARWSDLRSRRQAFEQAHEVNLGKLRTAATEHASAAAQLADIVKDRRADRDAQIGEKSRLEARLGTLEKQARAFADFNPELAEASRQNLKREEFRLSKLLSEAATESREKAQQKLALYTDLVKNREQTIANFDRLAITALRRQFSDDELDRAFRVLNFDLLETPIGNDGTVIRDEARLLSVIRDVAARVQGGAYEDEAVRIALRPGRTTVGDLANVERLREELKDHSETLARWQMILKAINDREKLAADLKLRQSELAALERQLFAYEEFIQARAEEPRLQRDLKHTMEALAKLDRELADLDRKRQDAERQQREALDGVRDEENGYNEVMGRFGQCLFPEFSAAPIPVTETPSDFDAAIALYLKKQDAEQKLRESVERSFKDIAQLVGEDYSGADNTETVRNLRGELDALAVKTEALERDWNALIQGLRGTFAGVLKELDAVRSAVTDLNRQFGKIQVSNLRSMRLEVLEAGDLVTWFRRLVDLQQPGLFDDDTNLDQTLRNFRQKLEGSPLISFSQLFSLGLTVEGEDGVRHHYTDLKQIESHGTTIAIKVLFNLLVLRRYLREDVCVVPFFLDEVQALDPINRHAILTTARKLGFVAITAAPESITEVDALYFLQPQQGRIVLSNRYRLGVKRTPQE